MYDVTQMISIGYGNFMNAEKVIAVVSNDAAPVKRMIQTAKEQERIIDATHGKKTKSVIVTESNHIVLSALLPETLQSRFEHNKNGL